MEILYEESREYLARLDGGCERAVSNNGEDSARRHSGNNNNGNNNPSDLELQLTAASDHLLALLRREADDYSTPLPTRYYPGEFAEGSSSTGVDDRDDAAKKVAKKTTIGLWRKRIASWMYDVVDHFRYDHNAVSVALR